MMLLLIFFIPESAYYCVTIINACYFTQKCSGIRRGCSTILGPQVKRYDGWKFQCGGNDENHVFCEACAYNDVECPFCGADVEPGGRSPNEIY